MSPRSMQSPIYTPPAGDDEPLDAIEEALVRMWIDIIVADIQAEQFVQRTVNDDPSVRDDGDVVQERDSEAGA